MGAWVFGCDICQMVCPWNRFAPENGDRALESASPFQAPVLDVEIQVSAQDFDVRFRRSPIRRAKHEGYVRNAIVAAGNAAGTEVLPVLHRIGHTDNDLLKEHALWAAQRIQERQADNPEIAASHR